MDSDKLSMLSNSSDSASLNELEDSNSDKQKVLQLRQILFYLVGGGTTDAMKLKQVRAPGQNIPFGLFVSDMVFI